MDKKVCKGKTYKYIPVPLDILMGEHIERAGVKKGDVLRVVQPYGVPRNGTMGMVYTETEAGQFVGLVCANSLEDLS